MIAALLAMAFHPCPPRPPQEPAVVPRPASIAIGEGRVRATAIACDAAAFAPQIAALADGLRRLGATRFVVADGDTAARAGVVVQQREGDAGAESYAINTEGEHLVVRASGPRGVARAAATLLQHANVAEGAAVWPTLRIEDAADLPFRCFLVDMGRNPHSPTTLRAVVDACWFYKVSLLQLHLSDDQLFSWTSTAFPKLHDARAGWTRQQFVELAAYAAARGVAIVPEIDVPGHSTILRDRYPEVFGRTPEDLATGETAAQGVLRLIDEMLEVFGDTPYVHLGGDEVYGVSATVQRAFLNRLSRHVRSRGRRAIAWEGPPLGTGDDRLDRDIVLMSWETSYVPAQEMLDAGHAVVNASWNPMYIVDHYPRTMFTACPLDLCYGWDRRRFAHIDAGYPTFATPHVTKTGLGILGFCMPWWEGREENLLGLCVPRLAAVAAGAWHRDGERDFADFMARQQRLLPVYERLAGVTLPRLPIADPATQRDDLAFGAPVQVSAGAHQPVFGPERLTNGITEPFDHFLGFPTRPDPLVITVDLGRAQDIARVVVHETARGDSHEVYEVSVSVDGERFDEVGKAGAGSRGAKSYVEHGFAPRPVRWIRIRTHGCEGMVFPTFSRLVEIQAFAH